MHLNLESTQKFAQVLYYIFVLITGINKISFTLVSSENIPSIPLRLYQTKQVESPQSQHNVFEEKLEDVFKRGTGAGFYGLRGKMLSDNDVESLEEKRSAFYPMRGKKKPGAFTALRGKKEFNADAYDGESHTKESSQLTQEKNSTPIQNPTNTERLRDYMNMKMNNFIPGDKVTSANNPYFQSLHTDNESMQTRPWKDMPNQDKVSLDSSNDIGSRIVDDDSIVDDNILAKMNEENESDDDQIINKRRNSGFIPMRGRKFYSAVMNQLQNDKRKSSFIPMRGKKSSAVVGEWLTSSGESLPGPDKKSVGFLPMRGRKSIFSISRSNRYQQKTRWPFSEGKRVAFHAVRGKKNILMSDLNYPRTAFSSPSSPDEQIEDYDNESNEGTSEYADSFAKNFASSINHGPLLRIRRNLQGKLTRGKSRATVGIKRPSTFFASRGKRYGSHSMLSETSLNLS